MVFQHFSSINPFRNSIQPIDPFRNFPVRHRKCSCVCTIENHNVKEITIDITILNKNHLLNWCTWQHQWGRPVSLQITPQHDSFKTRITPKLATASGVFKGRRARHLPRAPPFWGSHLRCYTRKFSLLLMKNLLFTHIMYYKTDHQ